MDKIRRNQDKNWIATNTDFASGGLTCKLGALYPAPAGFSAGRPLCASNSASWPSAKTLCATLQTDNSDKIK